MSTLLYTVELALQELALFRRREEIDTNNAIAIADALEQLVMELASGDPEIAELYDKYRHAVLGEEEHGANV